MTVANATVLGYPSTRDEAWRYTPVDAIVARLTSGASSGRPLHRAAITPADVDRLAGDHGGPRLVFVNGVHDPHLSRIGAVPPGLSCRISCETERHATAGRAAADGFLARNRAAGHDGAVIEVDAGATIDGPVHVVHVSVARGAGDDPVVTHPHATIDVCEGGSVTIIETFCGLGEGPAVTNTSTTVRLGGRAAVDHYRIQDEGAATAHVGHTGIHQEAGSHLRLTAVTIGADLARNAVAARLAAPGARIDLAGLNVTSGRQRHDTVATIDHTAPRCTSRQRVRGVVDDHGRGSFSGEIIVRPGADGSDADQSNRNLVLSADAQADIRPWLRILADNVACTHGATVGRLDDDALFYLRSRGIPLTLARAMLIAAFVDDITDGIAPPTLRQHVDAIVHGRQAGPWADRREAS
jgi:Fe-S cluster assembly protein SufD